MAAGLVLLFLSNYIDRIVVQRRAEDHSVAQCSKLYATGRKVAGFGSEFA
jgi:hypothetical protein